MSQEKLLTASTKFGWRMWYVVCAGIGVPTMLTYPQDYNDAAGNADQQWLASQGITLSNYYAVGHTSQPNYCAAASGDNYGMDNGQDASFRAKVPS